MHRKLRQNNPTDPFKDFGAIGIYARTQYWLYCLRHGTARIGSIGKHKEVIFDCYPIWKSMESNPNQSWFHEPSTEQNHS